MASEYYVTIKLDPHYQRFLRSHFQCESEIFEFPARHYFNTLLEHFVSTKRNGHEHCTQDEWTFKIALPNFAKKNSAFFRYLSETKEGIFKSEIKDYYDWIILHRIRELMSTKHKREDGTIQHLDRQQCTLSLIEEYQFNEDKDCFDRIYKMFTRFQGSERVMQFRQKKAKAEREQPTNQTS